MASYFWDKTQDKFVALDRIRNFEIQVVRGSKVRIIGWISDTETVEVGIFDDKEQAQSFLEHLEIFTFPQVK